MKNGNLPLLAASDAAHDAPDLFDFENVSAYLTAMELWQRPHVDALLSTIDILRPAAGISEWNGPSGRLLGQRILQECAMRGQAVRDWTISELVDLCERVRVEFRDLHDRANEATG